MVAAAATLDDAPDIKPQQNIFCRSDADWYVEDADLPKHNTLPDKD